MSRTEDDVPASPVRVEEMIVTLRGERVILDYHLARLYGVTTKALNQAVSRNPGRFPADFVFQLTMQEKHRNPRFLPYAFTEHGALMAANVLNSPRAVKRYVG